MKFFAIAKADLASYKDQRRKVHPSAHPSPVLTLAPPGMEVSLDAKQSKAELQIYLGHKKAYLTASAEASNPMTSSKAQRLLKLSNASLNKYKIFQANIKTSYAKAQLYQRRYFKTSKDYHEKSVAAAAAAPAEASEAAAPEAAPATAIIAIINGTAAVTITAHN